VNIEKDILTNNQGEGGARPTTTTTTTTLIREDYSQPRGGGFRAGAYSVTNGTFQSTRDDLNHADNMDVIDNDVEDGRPSQHPAEEEGAAPIHA
jgi:hypothetical protein